MQEQRKQPDVATTVETQGNATVRQPWRRPTLQRLNVSLDTAESSGSKSDGIGQHSPDP